jgi:hypothetical protein
MNRFCGVGGIPVIGRAVAGRPVNAGAGGWSGDGIGTAGIGATATASAANLTQGTDRIAPGITPERGVSVNPAAHGRRSSPVLPVWENGPGVRCRRCVHLDARRNRLASGRW